MTILGVLGSIYVMDWTRSIGWRRARRLALLLAASASAAVAQGSLVIESTPPSARVEVDGRHVGSSPVTVPLEAGAHRVVLTRIGYQAWEQTVRVADGERVEVRAELERSLGTIVVEGVPAGSTIFVNGVPADGPVQAEAGGVSVRVEVPGERPLNIGAPVSSGAETVVSYAANPRDPLRVGVAVLGPGALQISGGRPVAGVLVLSAMAGSAAFAIQRQGTYSSIRQEHEVASNVYFAAGSEAEVIEALAVLDEIEARGRDVRSVQRRALLVGLAAYTLGAIDGLIHHTRRPRLRFSTPRFPNLSAEGTGVRLTFSL